MRNSTSPALCAPNTFPFSSNNTLLSPSESKLKRICDNEPLTRIYGSENRSWWDSVDEEQIYKTLSDRNFQDYVFLVELSA